MCAPSRVGLSVQLFCTTSNAKPKLFWELSPRRSLTSGRANIFCLQAGAPLYACAPVVANLYFFPGMMRAAGPLPRRRATLLHKFPWTLSPRPGARWVRRPVRLAPPPKEHAPQIPFRVVLHWGLRDCSWHFSMAAHCSSLPPLRSSLPPLRAQCDPARARETGRAKSYTSNTECWYFPRLFLRWRWHFVMLQAPFRAAEPRAPFRA